MIAACGQEQTQRSLALVVQPVQIVAPSQGEHMQLMSKVVAATLVVAVAVIGGFAAVPVDAQSKPPGYLVAEFQVTDAVGWKAYTDAVRALPTSGKPIVRATKGVGLSGEQPRTISIFRFPSVEEALAFDSSPGYVALKAARDKSSIWRSYVVEGLPD
jgi:uncharacterized protein (DUF1330 family)